jgi:hypothetical protein
MTFLPRIAVTMGDPAGIGPEICLHLLNNAEVSRACAPVVFGDAEVLRRVAAATGISFSALLGCGHGDFTPTLTQPGMPVLLLCGSLAAWDSGRAGEMKVRGFTVQTLDQPISPLIWQHTQKLMLAIGHPDHADTATVTEELIEAALPLIIAQNNLRIGLEGGATAMALIRRMSWTRFQVLPEGHTGVGTLRPPGGPILCVKPGSYPWPKSCFECQD